MIAHSDLAVLERDDTDEALVERVRAGDTAAFEDLYRRHSGLAVSVARKMLRSPQDAEDAAAEAFTNVLSALRRQVGPREMFRPYLLACVKNTCLQRIRQRSKQACTRDRTFADAEPMEDEKVVEGAVAAAAFQSMPVRWQSALWMAEVEHLDPVTIAERLDVNVPSAGALVYRARQGFTEAYLAQHLSRAGKPACAALGPKLAQYVRGTAGLMASRQVQHHIEECSACAAAIAELSDVNSSLRSLTGPALVSAVGATAAVAAGGSATVAISGFGWLMKAAAIAALSTTPFLVGSDAPASVAATGLVPVNATHRTHIEHDTPATRAADPSAGNRGHVAVPGPADATSGHLTPTPGGIPVGGPIDIAEPPVLGVIAPTTPVAPPAIGEVIADVGDGAVETALSSLPELPSIPSIVLPELATPAIATPAIAVLPEITIPAISLLPGVVIPEITVPAITVPAVSVPAITIPQVSIPAISLPSIPSLIGPLDRHISVTLGG